MDKYVVISFNEDGDLPSVEQLTGEQLKNRLDEEYYGSRPVFAKPGELIAQDSFVGLVVIKGEIVEPKPVNVATEYDL